MMDLKYFDSFTGIQVFSVIEIVIMKYEIRIYFFLHLFILVYRYVFQDNMVLIYMECFVQF